MSFLHKIWDDTLAGPPPDSGLGKLRKYNSFSASQSPPMTSKNIPTSTSTSTPIPIPIPISRRMSIDIPTTPSSPLSRNSPGDRTSFPDSPIGSTTPRTPPATPPETPGGEDRKRLTRRKSDDFYRRRPVEGSERISPTVYDWIVITALDR